MVKRALSLRNQVGGARSDVENVAETSDDETADEADPENEESMIKRYWVLIKNQISSTKTNPNHQYVNFNLLGKELTTELVMGHLRWILAHYSNSKNQIYVNPQLAFFLYDQSGHRIIKYWYASANSALFTKYRLLSVETLQKLESDLDNLYLLNWPFQAKLQARDKSNLGFTLLTNISYSTIISYDDE